MAFASATTWLQRVRESTLDLLFPPSCAACYADMEEMPDRIFLCQTCRDLVPRVTWPVCRRCAARVPTIPGDVSECGHCRGDKLRFDRALALGSYEGLLSELILRMKTQRSELLTREFGRWMANRLGETLRELEPSAIVPIPIHPWRRLLRGTNPPASLAMGLSREIGVPIMPGLCRRRNTPSQKGLSRPGRFRNVRNEMRAKAGYPLDASHVLLVDDLLTTGATCSEAARALKCAGVAQVTVLVVGRTPKN